MNRKSHTKEQPSPLPPGKAQDPDILSLTNQELANFMVNEYLENPLLENADQKDNEIMTSIEKFSDAAESYSRQNPGSPEDEDLGEQELSAKTGDSLKENLLNQLDWNGHPGQQWKIMSYLIDCLDEKGFFPYDTQELAHASGYKKEDLDQCLAILRQLEPAGIFSPNLEECLIRQLEQKGLADEKLCLLIREHLTDLVDGQISTVSRSLGLSTIQVKEYIHLIGSLNPRPLMDICREESSYVVPDILVSRHGGTWLVELNDQWIGEYRYNDYYLHLMKESSDPELTAYFTERLNRAKFVISCIEQRRKIITCVTEAILLRQNDYFERKGPLQPMTPEEIARDLGLDVSTVKRAIAGKYMQYKKPLSLETLFTPSSL